MLRYQKLVLTNLQPKSKPNICIAVSGQRPCQTVSGGKDSFNFQVKWSPITPAREYSVSLSLHGLFSGDNCIFTAFTAIFCFYGAFSGNFA